MIIVRGVNVFPTAVSVVLNRFTELSGEFRIVLEGSGPYHRLPVEAELAEGHDLLPNLAEVVEGALKDQLGATAEVVLLPSLSLPRTHGKTQQALAMGLCWRLLPEESFFAEAQKVAERIAELPERGVRDVKRIVNRADQIALEEALTLEIDAVVPAFLDPDSAERIASFKD